MDCWPGRVNNYLGDNVNVTTPFHCDYGYNISISDNVVIGPHVTISTLKTPTDTKSQKGSDSTETARETIIGQNI